LKVVNFNLTISNGTQSSIKHSINDSQVRGSCFQEREKEDGKDEACFWHAHWNVQDFGEKLSLNAFGLNVRCDISVDIVSKDELVTYFGKRSSFGRSNHVIY
jgi:hypothetical protein